MYTSETQIRPEETGTYEKARARAGEVCEQTTRLVKEHPGTSALTMFAIGCGVGLAATLLLLPPRRRTYDSHWPQWASRSHLMETIERLVPDAVSRCLSRHS